MRYTHNVDVKGFVAAAALTAFVVALAALALAVAPARAEFGLTGFDGQIASDAAGDPFTQAGGHPFEFSTEVSFNAHPDPTVFNTLRPDGDVKDIVVDLPPGFIGNPGAAPRCTFAQLLNGPICPLDSIVGTARIRINLNTLTMPLYNMVAPPGVPASFSFLVNDAPATLTASVRGGGDYGVTVSSRNIPEGLRLLEVKTTLWGVPADPSHDEDRCNPNGVTEYLPCGQGTGGSPAGVPPTAFFREPTSCTAPGVGLAVAARVDSWENPGVFVQAGFFTHQPPNLGEEGAPGSQVALTGCDGVPFDPSIVVQPTSTSPDSPSGLNVTLGVPQEGLSNPAAIAQADLRKVRVSLPEGVAVNPSSADGLGSCSEAQIGLHDSGAAACPQDSRIGTAEIDTPLLDTPLEGSVYLAAQNENPFGSLLALYLVVEGQGAVIKLPGNVEADPVSGRLTATFDNSPQVPFNTVKLRFKGGPRAPLVTPAVCGGTSVASTLEGWNGKSVSITGAYSVDCTPGLGGFSPSFSAGTVNNQGGAFSPLTVTFSRNDGEQQLNGLRMTAPPGLLGVLRSVVQCPEPQASQGVCGEDSLIGHATAGVGAGPTPFWAQGGRVYLTGPYKGAPFGLSVVVPAKAGPFDLGTVVVRAKIEIDPRTAQVTIVSDPLPTILQGIPLRLRTVNVTVDRSGFMFNPTNCEPLAVEGTLTSTQGATANVSSHFQAANCAALAFHPTFKVSTTGATSKTNGASLDVKVTSGTGQANLGKVAVSLPKQLPSRLTTIQQACPEAVFAANPASCPAGSNIGVATATTPILANPVTGPAYLVSHGGAAFPDLVMVLQGEGVTVQVTGGIDIKNGITSSAFNAVPDVPISTFEVNLPQGPHSALGTNLPKAAKNSLCGQSLTMPTTMTGQNGAQIKQSTKIAVTGCPKAKKTKKKPKKHATAKKRGKGK